MVNLQHEATQLASLQLEVTRVVNLRHEVEWVAVL